MTEILVNIIFLVSYTMSADNGIYRCSIVYAMGAHFSVESFSLYQNDELVYTKEQPGVSTFFLCNTGNVFALNENRLYLYTQNGGETLLKNLHYPNGFGFSPDGMLFFCSDIDGIYAYSDRGQLVHTFKPGRLFASTERGKKVAVISRDSLFLYEDRVQKFWRQLRTPYARAVFFSQDRSTIVVEEGLENEVFDSNSGEKAYPK